jgi:thiamine kinase-like enzyme
MEKDKKRFNRSKKQTQLSLEDAQSVLVDVSNSEIERLEYLEGGFSNTNYLVRFKNKEMPVVIRIGDLTSRQFEIETSISTTYTNIKAPLLLKKTILRELNVAIYKFYDGILLSLLLESNKYPPELAENIGKSLADVHKIKFDHSGFFNDKLEVETITSNFGEELVDFTLSNLKSSIAIQKMGTALNNEIINLIKDHTDRLKRLQDTCSLVHFDFNPKNLLASRGEVQVILDWEYAASGSPLVDIANFFRFEEDYTDDFLNSFICGYQNAGGELPEDWRQIIKLLDLASMSNFITRSNELDASSKTAIKVFMQTAKYMK